MSNDNENIFERVFERVFGGSGRNRSRRGPSQTPAEVDAQRERNHQFEVERLQREVERIRRADNETGRRVERDSAREMFGSDRITSAGMAMMTGRSEGRSIHQQNEIRRMTMDMNGYERHMYETLGVIPERLGLTENDNNEVQPMETRNSQLINTGEPSRVRGGRPNTQMMDEAGITPGPGLREQLTNSSRVEYRNDITPEQVASLADTLTTSSSGEYRIMTDSSGMNQFNSALGVQLGSNPLLGSTTIHSTGSTLGSNYQTPSWFNTTQESFLFEEKEDKYMFQVACPGVSKEDLKFFFQYIDRGDHEVQQLCLEIPSSKFTDWTSKQIDILDDSDMDSFAISIENGVLTAVISKYKEETEYDSEI